MAQINLNDNSVPLKDQPIRPLTPSSNVASIDSFENDFDTLVSTMSDLLTNLDRKVHSLGRQRNQIMEDLRVKDEKIQVDLARLEQE